MGKMMNRAANAMVLLSLLLFRKTGCEPFNFVYIKKALAKSLEIFKPKCSRLAFQDWFHY